MTDVSNSGDRADALGKLGVSYGVGMVVGPMVGGYITTAQSEQFAAGVAAGLCLVAILVVIVFVPRTTKHALKKQDSSKAHGKSISYSLLSLFTGPHLLIVF